MEFWRIFWVSDSMFFFWFCVILWDILGFLWNMFGFLCIFFVISKPQIDNLNSGIPASFLRVNIIELSILESLFSTFFVVTMSPKQMQKHFKLSLKHSRVLLFHLFGAYSLRQTKIQNISRYWDLKKDKKGVRLSAEEAPFIGSGTNWPMAMAILKLEGDDEAKKE